MTQKEVTLDVAAFLDAPEARTLAGIAVRDVRAIAELFLLAAYEDLGKKPRLLDDTDLETLLGESLPARMKPRDPRAEHVPAVLRAYLDHLEATQAVTRSYELRKGFEASIDGFVATVRTGKNEQQRVARQDPVVHHAPKLGRNDPCFCGSGKKFKKCHGKNA